MLGPLYTLQHETRVAEAVDFRFADAPAPAAPSEAQLHRWYDNHPKQYTSPEYRRIRAVILDPAAIEQEVPVSDAELRAAYDRRKAEFTQPERRTVQVLSLPDEATARRLSTEWTTGTDWETIRKQAEAAGGTATELAAATPDQFPAPELAQAAFATAADTVSLPVKSELGGWFVVRVIQIDAAGTKSFEDVRAQLRQPLAADRAADILDQRATQLDQDLESGRTLDDQLAGNPIAEEGTLDARGMTPDGNPAPLRGTPALRAALIAAAFQAHPGDPLKLERVAPETPRGLPSYYAVQVQKIIAPAVRPYDQVADQVRTDWMADQRRREQDAAATRLMTAIQGGQTMAAAASGAGLRVRDLPPVTRAGGVAQVPEKLVGVLFGLRQGETTMVETPDGFMVARLARIDDPSPADDAIGAAQLKEQLDRSVQNDLQASLVVAIRNRARPDINRAAVQQLVQAGE
jgi:peptidyl-prolyl cis-trans isomerase D